MEKYKAKEEEGCCSKSLVRNYLYVYNLFFLAASLTVLAIGVWSILAQHAFISLVLSDVSYPLTSYLLVGAGVIGLVAALIGCCGISKEDRCLLLIFIILLLLVFLLEVMGGTLAYIYREEAFQDLQTRLNSTFTDRYGLDAQKTGAIDQMQREFHCCGSGSYENWQGSRWVIEGLNGGNKVPDSCCKTPGLSCGLRDHPSNIYYTGCIHRLSDTVRNHLGYLTIAGLGLCILQIIGVIFSTSLYIKLKHPERTDL